MIDNREFGPNSPLNVQCSDRAKGEGLTLKDFNESDQSISLLTYFLQLEDDPKKHKFTREELSDLTRMWLKFDVLRLNVLKLDNENAFIHLVNNDYFRQFSDSNFAFRSHKYFTISKYPF